MPHGAARDAARCRGLPATWRRALERRSRKMHASLGARCERTGSILPPLADAPRCSCSLGLVALILLYRRRKSRRAPNDWRQRQTQRRSWTAGPPAMPSMMDQSTKDFLSPYDHCVARSTVPFNGRSPDHHKKSPGKVSPSPSSSAASVCFLWVGGAATAGASSSTCGQARRVCASAAALGWGGGCSAPAVHRPSTPPHCT